MAVRRALPLFRDAARCQAARERDRGAEARRSEHDQAWGGPLPPGLRLLSRRAGDPGKPNSQAHAAATARIGGDDAAVAAERPILDRQERLQIYRHAGMNRDRTRGRDLGRRRVSHAYPNAGCRGLSRPSAGKRPIAGAERRRTRNRGIKSEGLRCLCALPRG